VRDDGVGLSAARLTDFNRGVGLANTRSRLQHLYGSAHRFEFRQPPLGGLSVRIAIPVVETTTEQDIGITAGATSTRRRRTVREELA
jgi:sensor histidine kinase YesM